MGPTRRSSPVASPPSPPIYRRARRRVEARARPPLRYSARTPTPSVAVRTAAAPTPRRRAFASSPSREGRATALSRRTDESSPTRPSRGPPGTRIDARRALETDCIARSGSTREARRAPREDFRGADRSPSKRLRAVIGARDGTPASNRGLTVDVPRAVEGLTGQNRREERRDEKGWRAVRRLDPRRDVVAEYPNRTAASAPARPSPGFSNRSDARICTPRYSPSSWLVRTRPSAVPFSGPREEKSRQSHPPRAP